MINSRTPPAVTTGPPVRFTDGVIDAFELALASRAPERGGALLAVGDLVYLFAEDTSGTYTSVSYDISEAMSETVGHLESAGHGTLAGTVHSHPSGLPDPSGQDVVTTSHALDMNPHLDRMIIAVLTSGAPRPGDMPVGKTHRVSVHVLGRDEHGRPTRLLRVGGQVVPLCADLASADVTYSSATSVAEWSDRGAQSTTRPSPAIPSVVNFSGRPRLAVRAHPERPSVLYIDAGYPIVGPIAASQEDHGSPLRAVPSPWDPVAPAVPQLRALVRAAVGARVDGANDRTWPLVGSLAGKKVLVAGLGSVGSRISEDLVRSGVGEFVLVDPEQIEASNLARTVYAAADVGTAKVDALSRRLRAIDPAVRISGHPASLADVALEDLLEGVDLVIGATDHMPDQTVLSHHAYHAGVPMVACALYREAAAGEVVLSVPSASTACWACTVGEGSTSSQYRPGKDYGLGGRLVGEAALGPSIHLVANVATIAALGLLADPGNPVHERIVPLLDARRTLGLVSSVPNWEFFAQIFEGQSHQFAPQSVWAKVAGDPACPVCGPERMAPPTRATGVAFRALLQNLSGAEGAEREEGGPSGTEPSNAGLVDEYEADCGAGRYGDGPQGAKLPR